MWGGGRGWQVRDVEVITVATCRGNIFGFSTALALIPVGATALRVKIILHDLHEDVDLRDPDIAVAASMCIGEHVLRERKVQRSILVRTLIVIAMPVLSDFERIMVGWWRRVHMLVAR